MFLLRPKTLPRLAQLTLKPGLFNVNGRVYSGFSSSNQSSTAPKDSSKQDNFENVNKEKTHPLHKDGHCSLEDRAAPIYEKENESPILEDIKNLPSEKESQRSEISKWITANLDKLQTTIFTAGQTLNDITGYSSIEKLKISIENQEIQTQVAREAVRACKETYANAISNRSASQREVNELLQRKHAWSPADLERFTELYRNDHANQHSEAQAEEKLSQAERELDESQLKMTRLISARYHEEQIWSDKIRRASTYGTWILMGFNVFLFIVVQLGLEPWKRKRLVGSFEDKVKQALEDDKETRLNAGLNASSELTLSSRDSDKLERLETLQAQTLQVLSTALLAQPRAPEVTEASLPSVDEPSLSWENLPDRLFGSSDITVSQSYRSEEIAGLAGLGAAAGFILGALVTLAARGS